MGRSTTASRQALCSSIGRKNSTRPGNYGAVRTRPTCSAITSVKDNGPGIPDDEIPIVLSAFGQGSIAIKSAEQGTGLGLPIAKNLVDLHGGTFTLKSKLRFGTEVIVTFPAERVMSALGPLEDHAPQAQTEPEAPKPSIRRQPLRSAS